MSENVSMRTSESPEPDPLPTMNPPVDVFENEEGYLIRADVPGVAEEDIDVRFERGELVFEARRGAAKNDDGSRLAYEFGPVRFRRAFRIPEAIAASEISAKLTGGVLELTLPKTADQRPRHIPVNGQ